MKNELLAKLKPHGQEHLLAGWDALDDAARSRLTAQIQGVDFSLLTELRTGQEAGPNWNEISRRAVPPPAYRLQDERRRTVADQAKAKGEEALRAGRVGMIMVAGGLGTRLGFDHPKGMFPLGPVSQRTLFQILIGRLLAVGRKYRVRIPLYLMTSLATHDETVAFLEKHQRFGLPAEDLIIFQQGSMPALDLATGKVLLAGPGELFLGPDGHGGMLAAFCNGENSCLADARRRGIEQLFYGQVDNPLTQVCDAELIGLHRLAQSEMTTQVVEKAGPLEKVGNVVAVDGRVQIIEYSDLPREAAERTDENGQPLLWAGNIAVHVFETAFLARVAAQANALPFHLAKKKTPYYDASAGQVVEPSTANSLKFERFIFDLLPFANNAIAVEAAKAEAFAPVKNANDEQVDTPATAQAAMIARHAALLKSLGTKVDDGIPVEVGSRFEVGDIDELTRLALGQMHIRQAMYFE